MFYTFWFIVSSVIHTYLRLPSGEFHIELPQAKAKDPKGFTSLLSSSWECIRISELGLV